MRTLRVVVVVVFGLCLLLRYCRSPSALLVDKRAPEADSELHDKIIDGSTFGEAETKNLNPLVKDKTFIDLLDEARRLGFEEGRNGQPLILVSKKQKIAYLYLDGKVVHTSKVRVPEHEPSYANQLAFLGPFNPCNGNHELSECDINPMFGGNSRIPGTRRNVSLLGSVAFPILGSQTLLVHGVPTDPELLSILGPDTSGCIAFQDNTVLEQVYYLIYKTSSPQLFYATYL